MKKSILNELAVLLITFVVLFFLLKDNFGLTLKIIGDINILLFLLGIFLYVVVFSLEAVVSMKLVKEYKSDYSFKEAFKLSVITRFFNGITPFSTGGRPLQIYELKKNGVRVTDGTNVIVQNFIIFQISLIIYSFIALVINLIFKMFSTNTFFYWMTIIGLFINIVILVVALLISSSKKITNKIIGVIIKFAYKIRIIKDKEKYYNKCEKICSDYYNAYKDFKKKRELTINCILIQLVSLTAFYSIIAIVFYSLGIEVTNMIAMIVASNFVFLAGCYIPIPGGSGGIEYAFAGYFSIFLNASILPSALIIWRFITYYLPTLVGGIVFNIRNKKNSE